MHPLLRAIIFITVYLGGILLLWWLYVPLWLSSGVSPALLVFMLGPALPFAWLASVAPPGRWRVTWWETLPTVSLPEMLLRVRRFFQPVDASHKIALTLRCCVSSLVFSTVSSLVQILVSAVGLTSVARRLQ